VFTEISRNNSIKEIENCINNLMWKARFFYKAQGVLPLLNFLLKKKKVFHRLLQKQCTS
jgi:hypothetical protein